MDWVITSGVDVENIRFILNAIAAIFNDGALKTLASVIVMLSLFFALVTYQTRPGGALSLVGRWFLILIFFFSLFHVKTTVSVYKSGSSMPSAQVDNVPAPVAFFGSFFTSLDYSIARLFDAAFSVPELLSSSKGAGFSSLDLYFRQGQDAVLSLVSSGNRYHIDNLNAFFDNCIAKTVMQGYINMQTLQTYGWKNVAGLVNPAFYTPIHKSDGSVDYVSCGSSDAIGAFRDAYDYLSSLPSSGSPLHKILFPAMDQGALSSMFVNGSTAAVAWLSGINSASLNQILADTATFNFFMQSLSRNSLNPASFAEGYIKVAGESCMQGVMSQRYLPFVKTIMFYLVFGALPLILLFLLSPMWKTTLLSVGTTGLWFAFWSGLTSVFNGIVGLLIRNSFSGYSGLAEPASVLWSVSFVNNYTDMVCMAYGYASYIPVIALTLASGSMYALTSVANSLAGTVKAAGDKVTDAYDFAGRETAMALDTARGMSLYNAISTTLAQADAVNAFAGGMFNTAYSNPFVKSTMVAAENQAYGIGAAMRHLVSAKTDKIAYSSTVYDDLKNFALYNRLSNSGHDFVNKLQAFAASRGIPLFVLPTSSGYELFINGTRVGEVKNGQANVLGTSFQLGGSISQVSNVVREASRDRGVREHTGVAQNLAYNQTAGESQNYNQTSGSQSDDTSGSSFNETKEHGYRTNDTKNFALSVGLGWPGGGGSRGPGTGGGGGGGSEKVPGKLETLFSSLTPKFSAGVSPHSAYQSTETWGFGKNVNLSRGINTSRSDIASKSNTDAFSTGFSVSQGVNRSQETSEGSSVKTSYSRNENENSNVSYSASVLPSELTDYVSQVTGLKPTTLNERALLGAVGTILTSLDNNFADGFLKTLSGKRLGIDTPPSEKVEEGMKNIQSEVDGKMKTLDELFEGFQEFIRNQQANIKGKVDGGDPYVFYNPEAVKKFFEQNADKIPDAPTFEQWSKKKIDEAIDFAKDNWKEITGGLVAMAAVKYGLPAVGKVLDKVVEKAAKNGVRLTPRDVVRFLRGAYQAVRSRAPGGNLSRIVRGAGYLGNLVVAGYALYQHFFGDPTYKEYKKMLDNYSKSLEQALRPYVLKDGEVTNVYTALKTLPHEVALGGNPEQVLSRALEVLSKLDPKHYERLALAGNLLPYAMEGDATAKSLYERLLAGSDAAVGEAMNYIEKLENKSNPRTVKK